MILGGACSSPVTEPYSPLDPSCEVFVSQCHELAENVPMKVMEVIRGLWDETGFSEYYELHVPQMSMSGVVLDDDGSSSDDDGSGEYDLRGEYIRIENATSVIVSQAR
jgi:hypothetical protein